MALADALQLLVNLPAAAVSLRELRRFRRGRRPGIERSDMAAQELIRQALERTEEIAVELHRGPGAREAALAKTKLEEAELWLEKSQSLAETAAQALTGD